MPSTKSAPSSSLFVGIFIVAVLTLAVTVYCGNLTGRFGNSHKQQEAGKLLKELPMTIGDWVAEKEELLPKTDVDQLEIENGYICRRYRNSKSHSEVFLTLMVGPTGRIVVHTPEFCFGGKNYTKEEGRTPVSFPIVAPAANAPTDDTFWQVNFINKDIQADKISFYYGVSTGQTWVAVENPRSEFSRYRFVYKMQTEALGAASGTADVASAFLTDALPTIHKHLLACE